MMDDMSVQESYIDQFGHGEEDNGEDYFEEYLPMTFAKRFSFEIDLVRIRLSGITSKLALTSLIDAYEKMEKIDLILPDDHPEKKNIAKIMGDIDNLIGIADLLVEETAPYMAKAQSEENFRKE